ncbi:alpha-L-fucosidase [Flavilitoribacter nigricans]|uniref:alpha-L-fucosidase n=1 Tax=Flavilitoribacter nigricans (strain ATCC 23147 / DSM 23189 / NBRC 102662 / NCIMB 1420 / SS-2) TaxID=1122177 RepID=A0A2D0N2K6_FLAN2|nr:alpha-L-fucosidase [Flavilitoribacter nigricans]PHN02782.1 alpha-L-fucosidase [Flavilitoribacter nigricans DSM 23189 = NBRC 102662]
MKTISITASLIIFSLLFSGCRIRPEQQKATNPDPLYQPEWISLQRHQTPEWFLDAKFGIYCHWGPYSVPAYQTEWYSHRMYLEGDPIRAYHESTYGPVHEFGYKDFIPMFTAERFDADEWAELFLRAGAKFGGPVSEHADGFAMWDSRLTRWDAKDMGPRRDVVGEMAVALRKRGLKFIATYHRHWMYAWFPTWDPQADASDPALSGLYGPKVPAGTFVMASQPTVPLPDEQFNREWYDRIVEVVDKYEPDLVWFDNKMDIIDEKYRLKFLSHYYNAGNRQGREVVATYKFTDFQPGSAVLDLERARMSESKPFPWLTDDSIDWKAWCDIQNPDYKSVNRLVDFLVDVVSKNGCLLLNITPQANGEIPAPVRERLLAMGDWLRINGEAIYGTRPWVMYGEGPTEIVEGHLSERRNADHSAQDIRYTTRGDALYAIVLDWPTDQVVLPALGTNSKWYGQQIGSVKLLGYEEELEWEQKVQGLVIKLGARPRDLEHAFVFRINGKP